MIGSLRFFFWGMGSEFRHLRRFLFAGSFWFLVPAAVCWQFHDPEPGRAQQWLSEIRAYDGWGNNRTRPHWGAAGTPLRRLSQANYPDAMRALDVDRPNPRDISNAVSVQVGSLPSSRHLSGFVWQWGQFLDHDLDLTRSDPSNGSATIAVNDPADPLWPAIPMFRSNYLPGTGTEVGNPRQQVNEVTAFIDGSNVYGSHPATTAQLRSFTSGRLRADDFALMPLDEGGQFMAGDVRANEQVGLLAMHTLFMREHNRLAERLSTSLAGLPEDPVAQDEVLFQAARKLLAAEMQVITFNEFLPALLGPYAPALGEASYDPGLDPSIANEFATALYRFGHTMLPPELNLRNDSGEIVESIRLRDAFFRPKMMSDNPQRVGWILKGLAVDPAQEVDTRLVDDVRTFLIVEGVQGGLDLAAINIQRGRDHGLPTYNDLRRSLGLAPASLFADVTPKEDLQRALASVYDDVEQIDAWVGGLAESPIEGSALGELLTRGLADQFFRLRDGDRLLHVYDPDVGLLAEAADLPLAQLRLRDIVLANTQLTNLQSNLFYVPEPASVLPWVLGGILVAVGRRRPSRRRAGAYFRRASST